jgi:hypothetical protein
MSFLIRAWVWAWASGGVRPLCWLFGLCASASVLRPLCFGLCASASVFRPTDADPRSCPRWDNVGPVADLPNLRDGCYTGAAKFMIFIGFFKIGALGQSAVFPGSAETSAPMLRMIGVPGRLSPPIQQRSPRPATEASRGACCWGAPRSRASDHAAPARLASSPGRRQVLTSPRAAQGWRPCQACTHSRTYPRTGEPKAARMHPRTHWRAKGRTDSPTPLARNHSCTHWRGRTQARTHAPTCSPCAALHALGCLSAAELYFAASRIATAVVRSASAGVGRADECVVLFSRGPRGRRAGAVYQRTTPMAL